MCEKHGSKYIGLAFNELPIPLSDYTVAHNVGSIHVAQLAVDLGWRFLLSMQKSDKCTNLAVGGRQYQYSRFLQALCNNYWHHKTETALHYSHILPLYCFACTFLSDQSYHLSMQLELTFWMNLILKFTPGILMFQTSLFSLNVFKTVSLSLLIRRLSVKRMYPQNGVLRKVIFNFTYVFLISHMYLSQIQVQL